VVQRAHPVEEVRDASDLPIQGIVGGFEGDVGVAGRDHHPAVNGEGGESNCAVQFGG
jgi:hypothetical protein